MQWPLLSLLYQSASKQKGSGSGISLDLSRILTDYPLKNFQYVHMKLLKFIKYNIYIYKFLTFINGGSMGRIRSAVQTGCNKLVKLGKITVFWYLCDKNNTGRSAN